MLRYFMQKVILSPFLLYFKFQDQFSLLKVIKLCKRAAKQLFISIFMDQIKLNITNYLLLLNKIKNYLKNSIINAFILINSAF